MEKGTRILSVLLSLLGAVQGSFRVCTDEQVAEELSKFLPGALDFLSVDIGIEFATLSQWMEHVSLLSFKIKDVNKFDVKYLEHLVEDIDGFTDHPLQIHQGNSRYYLYYRRNEIFFSIYESEDGENRLDVVIRSLRRPIDGDYSISVSSDMKSLARELTIFFPPGGISFQSGDDNEEILSGFYDLRRLPDFMNLIEQAVGKLAWELVSTAHLESIKVYIINAQNGSFTITSRVLPNERVFIKAVYYDNPH